MRAVVQRAEGASVTVAGAVTGSFDGPGLVALIGVTHGDDVAAARRLAAKVHDLRLFESDRLRERGIVLAADVGREVSASDAGLPLLVISQFTLYADTRKGRRPTWDQAAPGPVAEPLVDEVVAELRRRGATVSTGVFGADMSVALVNDGPFTVIVDV
jgi:D-tyrosyl-tRNA(Tyr) deacylase